ncbi:MAG: hypothetical protein R3314_11560, partial [Longimicrobiales bacterium]|nr:hypothetical protein [Longimicrobiales bacterium]
MTTRNHRSRAPLTVALMAVLAAGLTACLDHDEAVIIEPAGGELFKRYVALGNSVTTGFQSGGVNLQLQADAYPVLLAAKANAPFGIPELAMPGCPPPLVGPLTSTRIDTVSCNLRTFDAPNPVQNLAVPGANTGDISDPLGTGTLLNTLILGGRTQIGAMQDAEPTLVSVWIGNNDALGATLSGDPSALTPVATFEAEYDEIVAGITTAGPQDAILIGAADPMIVAPALQPGAYFWAIAQNPPPGLPTLNVSSNCAPFDLSG